MTTMYNNGTLGKIVWLIDLSYCELVSLSLSVFYSNRHHCSHIKPYLTHLSQDHLLEYFSDMVWKSR